jgi:hypothetical protein
MSTIDGTANYLRMEHRTDLTDGFRSNTMSYNPGLIQSLPPEDQKRLESSPEYQSTNNSIAGIKLSLKEPASKDEKKDLRRQLKGYQNVLRAFRRKKLRELQICQKVNYEPMESLDDQWDERRSKFNRFKHMLSDERIRLAKIITEPVSPRSDKWVSALKDLVVLRTTTSPVAFQEVLRPIDGRCPVHSCQKRMAEYARSPSTSADGLTLILCSLGFVYLHNGNTFTSATRKSTQISLDLSNFAFSVAFGKLVKKGGRRIVNITLTITTFLSDATHLLIAMGLPALGTVLFTLATQALLLTSAYSNSFPIIIGSFIFPIALNNTLQRLPMIWKHLTAPTTAVLLYVLPKKICSIIFRKFTKFQRTQNGYKVATAKISKKGNSAPVERYLKLQLKMIFRNSQYPLQRILMTTIPWN